VHRTSFAKALSGAIVAAGAAVSGAQADNGVISIRPTVARPGQLIEVRAGAYKSLPTPLPLYLVPRRQVPREHRCGPRSKNGVPIGFCPTVFARPPHAWPFVLVGRLDFRRASEPRHGPVPHPRQVSLRFRVPRLSPGLYELVIYCDPCAPGSRGAVITNPNALLRLRR
jgi:hypothetical protein